MIIKCNFPFSQTFQDYPDPSAWAVMIYVVGCDFNCQNCQNPKLRDYHKVKYYMHENEFLYQLKEATEKFKTKNVVLSGGDPLSINNRKFIKKLLSEQSNNYNFCIYTGYIIDEIKLFGIKGFKFIKCGQYVKDDPNLLKPLGKTDEYISFASRNQSLYNDRFELLSKDGTYFFKKEDNHGLTTLAGQYDRQDVESHKEYSNIESKT